MICPSLFLLLAGTALIIPAAIDDIFKGHIIGFLYFIPVILGYMGFIAAIYLVIDIASKRIRFMHLKMKWLGLILGLSSELTVTYFFPPNLEQFLYFWLPRVAGVFILFIFSYKITANKSLQRT